MQIKRLFLCRIGLPTALTATLLSSLSGCSFIFSEGPPPQHQQLPYFDCSTSYAPPVLDTIWGGLNGLGAISAAGSSDAAWNAKYTTSRSTVITSGLLWLALSGSSAVYGYTKVSQCNAAKTQLMMRSVRQPAPPPPYGPPPGYAPAPTYAPPPPAAAPPPPPPGPPPAAPAPPAPGTNLRAPSLTLTPALMAQALAP